MKKIKIRRKELKQIGYKNDRAVALALNLVKKHCKHPDKEEIMILLEKILLNPERFRKDKVFGALSEVLSGNQAVKKPGKTVFSNKLFEFIIYG